MKKHGLKSLLICILAISMLCTTAFASESSETTYVAEVNGTPYETLAAALAAASEDGTVKLLADVTGSTSSNLWISKNVTLDLDGHTLTAGYQVAVAVNQSATVTIKNGTLLGGTVSPAYTVANTTLNLENVTVTAASNSVSAIQSSGNLNLTGCTVDGGEGGGIWDFGTKTTVTLNDCDVTGGYFGVYHNGSTAGFTLNATNSTIIGDSDAACAIYVSGNATNTAEDKDGKNIINLTGCTVTGPTGIEGKFTDMVLTDCDITATAEQSSFEQYNNGSTALGFAVVSTDNTMSPASPAPNATITINGGTYNGLVGLSNLISTDTYTDFVEADITVSGGTFSGDVSDYLAEGVTDVEYNTVLRAATCTTNGIGKLVQVVNGEITTSYYTIPAAHKYTSEVTKDATCGTDGEMTYTCSACVEGTEGHTYTEAIPATGEHTWTETTIEATCTEGAKVGQKCQNCGYVGETVPVEGSEPLGHEMVLDTSAEGYVAATCTEGGHDVKKCSRCDYTEEADTAPLGHDWDEGTHQEATCTTASGVKYTCKTCSDTYVEEYPVGVGEAAKGHTEVASEDNKPATCVAEGLTGKTVCSVCSEVLNEGTVLPVDPDAHKYELTTTLKKADCTTTGIGKYTCQNEGCTATKYATIPADHNWGEGRVTKDATCGEDGEKTFTCSVCQKTKTEVIPATGEHEWEAEKEIPATCTEPAKVGQVCKDCGAQGEVQEVVGSEPLGHDLQLNTAAESYKAATCTEDGHEVYKCSRCDYTEEKDTEALGHQWDEGEHQDATCTTASGVKYTCKTCDATYVEEYPEGVGDPALGHTPEAVADVAATCSTPGLTGKVVCSVCKEVLDEGTELPIDPENHTWGLSNTLKEASCTATGIGKYTCSGCGATKYATIPADHQWNEGEETTPASCGEDGVKTYTCSVCQETKTEVIPATGNHTWTETTIEATCTEGMKVGQVCSVCDAEGETQPVGGSEPLGHDLKLVEDDSYVAATCTEGGHEVYKCSRCDYTEEKDTEALGHTWNEGAYVDAGCDYGAGVRYTCETCGDTYVDEFEGEMAVPATGHNYEAVVTKPTCQTGGYTTHTCTKCGDSYTDSETEPVADAHVYEEVKVMKAATCSATGIGKYECSKCGHTYYGIIEKIAHTFGDSAGEVTKEATCTEPGILTLTCTVCSETVEETIEALGHDWGDEQASEDGTYVYKACSRCDEIEIIFWLDCKHKTTEIRNAKDATCTEDGYTGDTVCTDCGTTVEEGETIPATGHTPGEAVRENEVAATETEDGSYDSVVYCTVCNEKLSSETIVIPATGSAACEHANTAIQNAKEATCTENGYTGDTVCTDCNEVIETGEEIPAAGHTPGEAVRENEVAATETEDGSYDSVVYCSVCGEEISRENVVIPATGPAACEHANTAIQNAKEATCTEDGYTGDTVCTVCNEVIETGEVIPAAGHTAVTDPAVEATCSGSGLTEGSHCSVCGDVIVAQETVPATGRHNYTGTLNEDGSVTYTCTECGDSFIEP